MGTHVSYLAAIAALLVILGLVLDAWRQAARRLAEGACGRIRPGRAAVNVAVGKIATTGELMRWLDQTIWENPRHLTEGTAVLATIDAKTKSTVHQLLDRLRAADRVAWQAHLAIKRRAIGSRSALGDALLDYVRCGQPDGPSDMHAWAAAVLEELEDSEAF